MPSATTETPPGGGRRSLLLKVALLCGVPALLGLAFASFRSFEHYVQHDPDFCAQCHVTQDQYTMWAEGEHHNVPCQACHEQTTAQALDSLRGFISSEPAKGSGPHTKVHSPKVPVNACIRCHEKKVGDWPQIGKSIGHKVHLKQGDITCKSCHARTIHKFGAALDACPDCHKGQAVRTTGMEKLHCNACHNFLNTNDTLIPTRRVCLDCHAARSVSMPERAQNEHMARFSCGVCHLPHQDKKTAHDQCLSCHEGIQQHPGLHAVPDHAACQDCHQAHTWLPQRKLCLECHDDKDKHHSEQTNCWSCHKTQSPAADLASPPTADGASEAPP
ncbi:MAG: hypothetical protein ACOYOB_15775 [Myxococcota bacterium]